MCTLSNLLLVEDTTSYLAKACCENDQPPKWQPGQAIFQWYTCRDVMICPLSKACYYVYQIADFEPGRQPNCVSFEDCSSCCNVSSIVYPRPSLGFKSTLVGGKHAAEPKSCIQSGVETAPTYLGSDLGKSLQP